MTNISAGVFFYAKDTERFLYLLRTDNKNPGNWGIPGGKVEQDETLFEGIARECNEEIGCFPINAKLIPIQKFVNHTFTYHTFFCAIDSEFIPILNDEHDGYAWTSYKKWPQPLHQGLKNTLRNRINQAKLDTVLRLIDFI